MYKFLKSIFLSTILLTSTICYASDNPYLQGYPEGKIMGFRGLDDSSTSPTVQDSRATDLLNVKISDALDLKKRYGYSVINSTLDDFDISSPAITGIFDSEYSNGTSYTYAFVGNKLKYDNSGVWTSVNGGGTITTGADNQWVCTMALDNAVCTNGTDAPLQVNSTPVKSQVSFSGLSNAVTKANAVIWYQNYLIFGNTTENSTARPTRFRWSNVGTINTWQDNNYVDIASLSGDSIVAFQELYGDLYIFMKKSIWKVSLVGGDDVFVFAKVIDGIGAISKGSVKLVTLPGDRLGIIFLNENKKVFLFNGVTVSDIGAIIQDTLDGLNPARLQYAVATFDGYDYFLSVSSSGISYNDLLLDYQVGIGEWTKHDQIDANAIARVKESTSIIKTYFGNYYAFVYWLDNPDNMNDCDGAVGVVDSVGYLTVPTMTYAQAVIDTGLADGIYTGAIFKITSGTGAGQEGVILTQLTAHTGIVVTTAFGTTPDSTSNYSIGQINSYYYTKWYDFGDSPRIKGFRQLYFWAKEASNNEVDVAYAEDFSSTLGSETKSLSPSSSSLWDSALWDTATWGTTGDKFYNIKLAGQGRLIQFRFTQDDIDKDFNIYGFHILADRLDRE